MLAKLTSKNQITIPKKIMDQIPEARYFEVELREGAVILKPLRTYSTSLNSIRSKVKDLGLKPDSVREAIEWARFRRYVSPCSCGGRRHIHHQRGPPSAVQLKFYKQIPILSPAEFISPAEGEGLI